MEYAAGIFLSLLTVAVLTNIRSGTLPEWLRAKFLNLAPGETIPLPTERISGGGVRTGEAAGERISGGGVRTGGGGSQIARMKAAVGVEFASDIQAGRLVIKGGVTSCRPMKPQPRGTKGVAYSEHAWSNAWDLYFGDRPVSVVRDVVAWLKAEKAAGRLPVGSILTYGWNANHVHIEGAPKRNPKPWVNVPPCAGR